MSLSGSRLSRIRQFEQTLFIPIGLCNRCYKFIQLANGALVLLVSDPTENVSSAALAVASGAYKDPPEIPGQAHLCEHMLLLGSRRYPKPNSLPRLVNSMNNGSLNAFTTGETTCYYFQMQCPNNDFVQLNEALQMMADMYRSPLFSRQYIYKEILAIDNEHVRNKSNVTKILFHALRLLADPQCIFNRFATGNFETLYEACNLQKHLFSYHREHYILAKTTIVLKSPQSIKILQKMAISCFDTAENAPLKQHLAEFAILEPLEGNPYGISHINKCIFVVNSNNNSTLARLVFPIALDLENFEESKRTLVFIEAFSSIIGDEGYGSLFSKLQDKLWIDGLSCFVSDLYCGTHCVIIEIGLTTVGKTKLSKIIHIVFLAIGTNFARPTELLAQYLSGLASIDLLNYLYCDPPSSAMDEVSDYAVALQKPLAVYGEGWILAGRQFYSDLEGFPGFYRQSCSKWRQDIAAKFIEFVKKYLYLNNFNLTIYGDEKIASNCGLSMLDYHGDQVYSDGWYEEKHFGFKYRYYKINVNDFNKLKVTIDPYIQLSSNPYIPEFALDNSEMFSKFNQNHLKSQNISLGFENNKAALLNTFPTLVGSDVWIKKEAMAKYSGKSLISADIVYECSVTAKTLVCNEILCEILSVKLVPKLYCSEQVDYSWNIITSCKNDIRVGIIIGGYNSKLDLLLDTILNELGLIKDNFKHTVSDITYKKARLKVKKLYKDLINQNSFQLATSASVMLLEEHSFGLKARIDELNENTYEDIEMFLQNSTPIHRNIFAQGDVTELKVLQMASLLDEYIGKHNRAPLYHIPSSHVITSGKNYCFEGASSDSTNSLLYYIQLGLKKDAFARTMAKLVGFVLALDAVNQLRTKKQLGYVVLTGRRIYRSTVGIHVSIVSGDYSPQTLEDETNLFLMLMEQRLNKLTSLEFDDKVKNAFLRTYIGNEDITERNIKNYIKGALETSSTSSDLEDLSMLSMMKTGGHLQNLNTDLGKRHLNYWNEILSKTYHFAPVRTDYHSEIQNYDIDLMVVKNLTKTVFINFWNETVSVNSLNRAKISIWITKQANINQPVTNDITTAMVSQIQLILRTNNLFISTKTLTEIVERNNQNQPVIMKEWLTYFMKNGKKLRVSILGLKSILTSLSGNLKSKVDRKSDTDVGITMPAVKLEKIKDLSQFYSVNLPSN